MSETTQPQHAMNNRFLPSAARLAVLTAFFLALSPVFAQQRPSRADTEKFNTEAARQALAAAAAENGAKSSDSLFDIEISGGKFTWKGKQREATLENVVDMLRERHDGANIVISPGAPRISIPNLKLRATTLEQELDALCVSSDNQVMWSLGVGNSMPPAVPPPGVDPMTGQPIGTAPGSVPQVAYTPPAPAPPSSPAKVPLYIISELPASLARPGARVEAFNLAEYFNSLGGDEDAHEALVQKSLDEIKKIVLTTLQAVDRNGRSEVSFQFHTGRSEEQTSELQSPY